jgi:phosphomannomutase
MMGDNTVDSIYFGTDGWRGIIGETFTFENVRLVAQAVAQLLKNRGILNKTVVIGYDCRFMSEFFARAVYDELIAEGVHAALSDRPIPTPALSFTAAGRGCILGIMITASHNPHFYNGIKFKAHYGGPVMPEFTVEMTRLLKKLKHASNAAPVYAPPIRMKDFLTPYLNALRSYADFSLLKKARLKVAVDSMHSTGGNLFEQLLKNTSIRIVSIRTERNPLFDYDLPEPAPPLLEPLAKLVRHEGCDVGLATDGDADRIGIVDSSGQFVTLHYLMPLLYEYLTHSRRKKGDAVRTTSTDNLFDEVCASFGRRCYEVPVGFGNICEVALERDILVGGEESGGVCYKNHIPERDGLLSGLLVLEMMAAEKMSLSEMVRDMARRFHPVEYLRIDKVFEQDKLRRNLAVLRNEPPERLAGTCIVSIDLKDGVKFYLQNGCWILMRVSDTEPKGRIYVGGPSLKDVRKTLRAGELLLFRKDF